MKKLLLLVFVIAFTATNMKAQMLSEPQVIDSTGTDFFYYWYAGTIGKQITVDSEGDVHVTYTKSYITEADTGYQVKYANVTDGLTLDVPSQQETAEVMPAVSFIGGGNGTPVYIMYGVGGRAYNYGPAMHLQAMAKVNDAGTGLDPLGVQEDQIYYADAHYANPFAMEVNSTDGIVHCLVTNPSGWEFAYWNFDGTNFGEIYNLQASYPDNGVPGTAVPGRHRKNAVEGVDLAVSADGQNVAVVALHSYNQIWIHKATLGGELWEPDFATAVTNGNLVPLFDTTQALQWLPDLYNANEARPYSDAQIVYDENDQLVVAYTATYRSHFLDTNGYSWGGWWRDHAAQPGDTMAVFYDGTEKAKPQIIAWTEASGTHTKVTESMYPMAGESFKWYSYGIPDSGNGFFGNAYADGIIGNLELVTNPNAAEGEAKFVLLFEQMATPAVDYVDTNWAFTHNYYAYKNDIFSIVSNDGINWTNLVNMTDTPELDENDVSAVIHDGNLHVMWTSDNFGGRDRGLTYADAFEDPTDPAFLRYSDGSHFSYPIRIKKEDQCEILYKSVPVSLVTDVDDEAIPTGYKVSQNYPNPFNPSTSISYNLPVKSDVSIKIYNNLGQLVTTLVNSVQSAGEHTVKWNASNIASGVYFYSVDAGDFTATKKMILLK